jgi:hypothetical protein
LCNTHQAKKNSGDGALFKGQRRDESRREVSVAVFLSPRSLMMQKTSIDGGVS